MTEELLNNIKYLNEAANEQIKDYQAIIKKLFEINAQDNHSRIEVIKSHLKLIIELLTSKYAIPFNINEENEMVNEAICQYLLYWVENANNAHQKVYSFAKQKYTVTQQQNRHKRGKDTLDVDSALVSSLYRGGDVYKDNISLSPQNNKNNKIYSFIDLCFIECYSEKYYIDLYRSLMYHKEPLQTISNTREITAIEEGYERYFTLLEEIKNEKNDMLFSIKSLFFLKFESTFRFLFAYQISKYSFDNNIAVNDDIIERISFYYKRIPLMGYVQGIDNSTLHRQNKEITQSAFRDEITDEIELKIYAARQIIATALAIYNTVSPFSITDDLNEDDFVYIAAFLKQEYKLFKIIDNANSAIISQDHERIIINNIINFYYNLGFVDKDRLYYARNIVMPKAKEKNKRKSKTEKQQ